MWPDLDLTYTVADFREDCHHRIHPTTRTLLAAQGLDYDDVVNEIAVRLLGPVRRLFDPTKSKLSSYVKRSIPYRLQDVLRTVGQRSGQSTNRARHALLDPTDLSDDFWGVAADHSPSVVAAITLAEIEARVDDDLDTWVVWQRYAKDRSVNDVAAELGVAGPRVSQRVRQWREKAMA